ncbi:MAG: NAD(P)H-binding protein [Rhodospirillaceae bacterium]|nr:NAD(P)H-binding protein [Rhodospirillaceae bacterium]
MFTFIRRSILVAAGAALLAGPALAADDGVLVFGGTGRLGSDIVRLLVEKGETVTVFARPSSNRDRLQGLAVNFVEGDVLKDAEVAAAFKGRAYRAAIVALIAPQGDLTFYSIAMKHIATHAKAAGVKQIIHHGAVGAGKNAENFKAEGWDKRPGLLERLADQGVGEDHIKASGLTYTIIRNARIYPEDTPSTGQAVLTEDHTSLTPNTRADLAIYTLQCLDNPACANKIYHMRDTSLAWPPPRRPE